MSSSRLLIWTGLSVLALGVVGCGDSTSKVTDGGDAGKTDGATDGAKTDGAKTDGANTDGAKTDGASGNTHPDGQTDGGALDLGGVAPPTTLTATVLDRRATTFELIWTAPSIGGAAVTGYQVRYAKVPITTANFDDTTVTTSVAYTGTPKAPGDTDGTIVKAYIENGYYFAVEGANATGDRSPIDATSVAVTAHFNVTTLTGTSTMANEQFGNQFDCSGDLNGDGRSDILAGSSAGQQAYIFFGASGTFSSSPPAVVFSGDATTTAFGRGVGVIGDIDKDGREDIAISDPLSTPPRLFIFKGRSTWPLTMTVSNADYVITPDASYDTSALGISITRLGDFNGDGVDDFAIGASQFKIAGVSVGRVVVILGKTSFSAITLPDATSTITIDGDTSLSSPLFGSRVLGLGNFYSATAGTTLIVSAPGLPSSPNSSQGHLYAFHGQAGTAGTISLSSSDNVFPGPAAGADIGNVLSNLGPMIGSLPSVGSGNPADTATTVGVTGSSFVFAGDVGTGPFGSRITLTQVGTIKSGQVIFGGGVPGRNSSYSLLGDQRPDLVLVPQTGPSIDLIDGNTVAALGAGPTDTAKIVAAAISPPSGWGNTGQGEGQIIPDINGDQYADFAIANAIGSVPGMIAVFW